MFFLLPCGRVQSNHDDKEILLCTLLIDATTLAEKTSHNVKLETVLPGVWHKTRCKHQQFAISKSVQINQYLSFEKSNVFVGNLKGAPKMESWRILRNLNGSQDEATYGFFTSKSQNTITEAPKLGGSNSDPNYITNGFAMPKLA